MRRDPGIAMCKVDAQPRKAGDYTYQDTLKMQQRKEQQK